jgi:integrase
MSIRWDPRNKRFRFEFRRVIAGRRHRVDRLLPHGWSAAEAHAFDATETRRLTRVAAGVERTDPLIDQAVALYLRDKTALKAYKATAEHLAAIAWAYVGKPLSALPAVAADVVARSEVSPGTVRGRLAYLKAACRWAWKQHGLTQEDPTTRMRLPKVKNERHVYVGRRDMLRACRACTHWQAQIAIRVCFYSGLRLGELYTVATESGAMVLGDTKNGDRRSVPAHPKIRHLLPLLPLTSPKITIQRAWQRARKAVGLEHVTIHDLRHSAASEMINAGVPLYVVGQVLGHRDSRSTARYSHLTADTLAGAVGMIGSKRRA